MVELKDIVNLDNYPIDQQDCDEYKKILLNYFVSTTSVPSAKIKSVSAANSLTAFAA